MRILYLSIAGFIIRLVFYRSSDKQSKVTPQRFIKEMLKYNEGFILSGTPTTINFTIEFLEVKGVDLLHDKHQNTYFRFFSFAGYHHIATYSYISRVQFVFILKEAIQELLGSRGYAIHCSANVVNGKAVIFLGTSGMGKTTISSMLQKEYPILADDEGYIRIHENRVFFYQGPFLERKYSFKKSPRKYEIGGIYLIEQAKKCVVLPLSPGELDTMLKKQALIAIPQKCSQVFKNIYSAKLQFNKRKEELMNCILDHPPFDDPSGFNTQ